MREFVFSGSSLSANIKLVTDGFSDNLKNVTVKEIKIGETILSELPPLGSKTQQEVALLSEFLRLPYSEMDVKEFAALHGLGLTRSDNDQSTTLVTTLLSSLNIENITHQSGNITRYAFAGSPDLSDVAANDLLSVSGATNESNNGLFYISTVNDGSDYVEIINPNRLDGSDDESSSPAVGIISSF